MSAELTPEVIDRLTADHYGWLTTGAKSGQPVPKLIWFYFDGAAVGSGIVVIGGEATVDATDADCRTDEPYWAKYSESAAKFGLTDAMANYSTRLKIAIDKVWTTPTEG
jgi:hypothetical protein